MGARSTISPAREFVLGARWRCDGARWVTKHDLDVSSAMATSPPSCRHEEEQQHGEHWLFALFAADACTRPKELDCWVRCCALWQWFLVNLMLLQCMANSVTSQFCV